MSSTNDGPAVSVDGLIFSYGAMRVLDQVALEVPTGEIFGLLGANGAGKTTLIRLLVGLLKPESGSVSVLGQTPSATRSTSVGYMPQLNALYEELSVEENVGFFARMYGMSDRSARLEAVESALQLVGLFDRRSDIILRLSPNPPMRSGLGVGTRGEGRGTRRSALDSDKWGRWRPLVVVGGADGGPGQRRWGGVGGTACRGRQSRTGPVRLCGSVG